MNRNCCPVLIDEVFRLKCEGNLICFLMEDEDGTKQLIHSVRYLSDTAF